MDIRWSNVVAFGLAIFAFTVFLKTHQQIAAFFSTIGSIGPGHSTDQQVTGLAAVGLIALTIVAIVKIVIKSGGNP